MSNPEDIIKKESELYEYHGEDEMVSSHDLAKELEKTKETVFSFKTGFETVDRLLDGVEAGELVVVTGPTSEGKTSFLMSVTKNIAEKNVKSAWFTLEVTPRQFIKKIMRSGNLPLFFVPKKNTENHIKWIEERIVEAKVKYDIRAVFIDHIHQVFSLQQMHRNLSLEIGDLVAKIKDIAIKNNLVVFLIAHSRDNSLTPNAEPRKEDIRDSGLISRVADTIISIHRIPNEDDGTLGKRKPIGENDYKAKIRVLKNRREGTMGFCVVYHKDHYLTDDWFSKGTPDE